MYYSIGRFITLSGTYYIIGRFYYIIGHVLQYRAFITLSVGTCLKIKSKNNNNKIIKKVHSENLYVGL